jgi:sialate O-acetylesterase
MKTRFLLVSLCATLSLAMSARADSDVHPNPLFSDHMVLQNGMTVPVWGTAGAGEKVTIKIAGQTKSVVTGADGKWMVRLTKLKAGGPFTMTIAGKAARTPITINDVLVGEVWLGSGQSNMVFNVSNTGHRPYGLLDEKQEIAAANYPQVRMFTVADTKSFAPLSEPKGEWKVCSPETVADFSAIGYLFARDLNQALKEPVGIILSAYGASTAEAWVPREALAADPKLKPVLDGFDTREAAFKAHPPAPAALPAADAQAPPVAATLVNPTAGLGAAATATGTGAGGAPAVGAAPPARRARGGGGDPVQDQHQPTVLYNGMINPVIPYAIRGAIWYQGESILGNPGIPLYGRVMETLVTTWRQLWGEGDFPFYAVQLAALKNNSNNPRVREQQAEILSLKNTGLAVAVDIGDSANVHPKNKEALCDRLSRIALANVYGKKMEFSGPVYAGMKVEGDAIRISFTHAQGLTTHYPEGLYAHVSSPPNAASTAEVPAANDGPLKWFQIAGADGKYVDAQATIDGSTVVVRSPEVPAPVSVRYAWDNYPYGANLYNAAGLPAVPFRTNKMDEPAPAPPAPRPVAAAPAPPNGE